MYPRPRPSGLAALRLAQDEERILRAARVDAPLRLGPAQAVENRVPMNAECPRGTRYASVGKRNGEQRLGEAVVSAGAALTFGARAGASGP
jgi:hypothetical protein